MALIKKNANVIDIKYGLVIDTAIVEFEGDSQRYAIPLIYDGRDTYFRFETIRYDLKDFRQSD